MLERIIRRLKQTAEEKEQKRGGEWLDWKDGISFRIKRDSAGKRYRVKIYLDKKWAGHTKLLRSDDGTVRVAQVEIRPEFRGERLSSNLVEQINFMLREYFEKDGTLANVIKEGPKRGLYERHGWERLSPGSSAMRYSRRPREE